MRVPPPVTTVLALVCVAVAAVTLGDAPVVDPAALAADPAGGSLGGLVTWWAAHASIGHLLANLGVLLWVAPSLERHVGSVRMGMAVVAGAVGGLVVHVLVHGGERPVLGASSVVASLVAYTLVVGWHCPFEDRRGRPVVWPGLLFHGLLTVEVVRTLGELAAGRSPSGAAAHLGGLVAGILVCGLLDGRWPARPDARRALRSRSVPEILAGSRRSRQESDAAVANPSVRVVTRTS